MPSWKLRVPASTSNLGPGFDQLGLCLSLWLEVTVEPLDRPGLVVEGPPGWPDPDGDRLVAAFRRGLGPDGPESGFRLRVASEIPIGRGLGSSGASVAAGLRLGRAAAGAARTDPRALLAAGIELEGHPDNVTASLFGGCTLCVPTDGEEPPVVRVAVHPDLGFVAAWPEAELPTPVARAALPAQVPFADAVENARRLPVLLEGLRTGDPRLLRFGGEDRLHVPYRLPLLPGAARALEAARAAGAHLATISGAGSALVAICALERRAAVAEALAEPIRLATGHATARELEVVRTVPDVQPAADR